MAYEEVDMEENKTLLQQVREKELVINKRLELASRDADMLITDAKKECGEIMKKSDEEGREAALIYIDNEKAKISADVEAVKLGSSKKAAAIREKAKANMPAVVDMIVKDVTLQ
jgi:vacuolar-type H+-ATPase subunit H